MRRGETNALLVAGLALVVAPTAMFLLLAGLYYYGLSLVPEAPHLAASSPAPETTRAAMWARFGGDGPMRVESTTPWSFVRMRVCRAIAGTLGTAEQKEDCWRNHPGIAAAGAAADRHVGGQGLSRGSLAQVATAAWMTRRWSAEELLDQLAWQSDYGYGWRGIEHAALGSSERSPAPLAFERRHSWPRLRIGPTRLTHGVVRRKRSPSGTGSCDAWHATAWSARLHSQARFRPRWRWSLATARRTPDRHDAPQGVTRRPRAQP